MVSNSASNRMAAWLKGTQRSGDNDATCWSNADSVALASSRTSDSAKHSVIARSLIASQGSVKLTLRRPMSLAAVEAERPPSPRPSPPGEGESLAVAGEFGVAPFRGATAVPFEGGRLAGFPLPGGLGRGGFGAGLLWIGRLALERRDLVLVLGGEFCSGGHDRLQELEAQVGRQLFEGAFHDATQGPFVSLAGRNAGDAIQPRHRVARVDEG